MDYTQSKWYNEHVMEIIMDDWMEHFVVRLVGIKQTMMFFEQCVLVNTSNEDL
jgi:hypothetical protein